jgi:diguanylate cyclase (GGDEF)-like protein
LDTPESTLLVVLQVISAILALLMFLAAKQARYREGVGLWVIAFAIHAVSQLLREVVGMRWGHQVSLPIGHLGGPLGYGVLYIGIRRYLGLVPRTELVVVGFLLAAVISIAAIAHGMNYASLSMTACFTALFQALTAATFWNAWQRDGGFARIGATAIFVASTAASLARAISLVPSWNIESNLVPANTFWLLAFIALNLMQAGSLLFLVNQSLLDELQNMADYDTLTGLLNRGGLARRMQRQHQRRDMPRSKRLGLLCMDLDHFKSVNDTYGHGAGDDVLKCLGKLLRENSRPRDLLSRQGGEEFDMVVEAGSEEELMALAERLRMVVESVPFPTRAGPLTVTISIGAALSRNPTESFEELGERADHALLEAKRAGRNRAVLAPVSAHDHVFATVSPSLT